MNKRLSDLHNMRLLPEAHIGYLNYLKIYHGFMPTVCYDIGACVLHWTNEAKRVWPEAKFVLFEAMEEAEFLYEGYEYEIGVFSDVAGKEIEFYCCPDNPGGNSYYREKEELSPLSKEYYNENSKRKLVTKTIDSVVSSRGFPLPDLVKIDVQGAEIDILSGMKNSLVNTQHLIIEMQLVEYNVGAPLIDETTRFLEQIGFRLESRITQGDIDADYHFIK